MVEFRAKTSEGQRWVSERTRSWWQRSAAVGGRHNQGMQAYANGSGQEVWKCSTRSTRRRWTSFSTWPSGHGVGRRSFSEQSVAQLAEEQSIAQLSPGQSMAQPPLGQSIARHPTGEEEATSSAGSAGGGARSTSSKGSNEVEVATLVVQGDMVASGGGWRNRSGTARMPQDAGSGR